MGIEQFPRTIEKIMKTEKSEEKSKEAEIKFMTPEELAKKAEEGEKQRIAEQERVAELQKVIKEAGKPAAGELKEERVGKELRETLEGE